MENTVVELKPYEAMLDSIKSLNTIANLEIANGLKLETLKTIANRLVKQIEDLDSMYCMDENGYLEPLEICECVEFDE